MIEYMVLKYYIKKLNGKCFGNSSDHTSQTEDIHQLFRRLLPWESPIKVASASWMSLRQYLQVMPHFHQAYISITQTNVRV